MAKRKGIYFTEEECKGVMGAFLSAEDANDFSLVENIDDLGFLGTKESISVLKKLKANEFVGARLILEEIENLS